MKNLKLLFLPMLFISLAGTNRSYGIPAAGPEPVPKLIQNFKLSELVKLSAKQFASLTGRKMNFGERIKFNFLKMKMRHDLKKDPNLQLKDYSKDGKKKMRTVWIVLIVIASILLLVGIIYVIALGDWASKH